VKRVRIAAEIETGPSGAALVTASIYRDGKLAEEFDFAEPDFDAGERRLARILDAFRAAVCP
jgi:hypothetical protein